MKKENMMSRVFFITVFIVQIVIYLVYKGYHADTFTFAFWDFFKEHKVLIVYLLIINIVTFALFAKDKIRAMEGGRRVRVLTLLGLSLIGGSIGGIIAMYYFRHKTKKDYFTIGMPMIIIMQVIVLFYIMNSGL